MKTKTKQKQQNAKKMQKKFSNKCVHTVARKILLNILNLGKFWKEKGTLGRRTFSNEKWTEKCTNNSWRSIISDQAAAAQILGWDAGGKKLGDCGIVGLWRNRDFWNFRIFHVFPYLKNGQNFTFQRVPPLVWRRKSGFPEEAGECRPGKKLQELGN